MAKRAGSVITMGSLYGPTYGVLRTYVVGPISNEDQHSPPRSLHTPYGVHHLYLVFLGSLEQEFIPICNFDHPRQPKSMLRPSSHLQRT